MDTRQPKIVDKPWGREIWYAHTDRYAGKVLEVDAGEVLSLQKHEVKHETLYLQSGRMRRPVCFTIGSGATSHGTPGAISPMNQGPFTIIAAVRSWANAVTARGAYKVFSR